MIAFWGYTEAWKRKIGSLFCCLLRRSIVYGPYVLLDTVQIKTCLLYCWMRAEHVLTRFQWTLILKYRGKSGKLILRLPH